MTLTIRRGKASDAEQIAELYLQFWEPHRRVDPLLVFINRPNHYNQMIAYKKDIRKKESYYFVAEKNENLLGFIEVNIKKNEPCFRVKRYGYINAATTHRDHRRQGIASALTRVALAFLKKKGITHIKTNVYNRNTIAKKTWQGFGFKPQSTMFIREER